MTVSIQFCGGCNPRIDRWSLACELVQSLGSMGFRVVFNAPDADYITFLSGCTSGCAAKYNPTGLPCTLVAGTNADGVEVEEAQLASLVLEIMLSRLRASASVPGQRTFMIYSHLKKRLFMSMKEIAIVCIVGGMLLFILRIFMRGYSLQGN